MTTTDQPLTETERADMLRYATYSSSERYHEDVPRLIAEIERLQDRYARVPDMVDRAFDKAARRVLGPTP